jgi:hypothetical protein
MDRVVTPEAERLYAALVEELAQQGVRLVNKRSAWHQRVAGALLSLVTLGGQRDYLDGYVTTLGRTIYVTPGWALRDPVDRYATLRHEAVHVRQFARHGWVVMAIGYLLVPLPLGLAWVRMRLEREAYEEGLRALYLVAGRRAVEAERERVCRQFTGPAYGWMWPFPRAVERWFDRFVEGLVASGPALP